MKTIAIVCCDSKGGIGVDTSDGKGTIPWVHREDMRLFRTATTGNTVIMGANTYWSLPDKYRPLPNRRSIIVTSNVQGVVDDVKRIPHYDRKFKNGSTFFALNNLALAWNKARSFRDPVFICGGASIYKQTVPYCDEVWVSRLPGDYCCHTFFPLETLEDFRVLDTIEYTEMTFTKYASNRKWSVMSLPSFNLKE